MNPGYGHDVAPDDFYRLRTRNARTVEGKYCARDCPHMQRPAPGHVGCCDEPLTFSSTDDHCLALCTPAGRKRLEQITTGPSLQDLRGDWLIDLWIESDPDQVLGRAGRIVMDLSLILERIEWEMEQLCAKSRVRSGLGLQLAMQRRRSSGAVALRWRTDRQRTLSAEAFALRLSGLPAEAARWYADLDVRARWLNSRERLVRHARQVMRDLYAERD